MSINTKLKGLSINGRAFAPGSSRITHVRVVRDSSGQLLLINSDDQIATRIMPEDVVLEPRIGSAPRRLNLPDGTLLETDDHDTLGALLGNKVNEGLHQWEGFHPRLAGVVGICLLGAWVIWRYGLGMLVTAAIWLTPQPVIQAIDAGTLQTVDYIMAEPSQLTESEKAAAHVIFKGLTDTLPKDAEQEFQLLFRDMPGMGPNAFALPGGTVVMTDRLIRQFPDKNVQAGVLGHEIGHVVEQHGLHQMYRSAGVYILIALLAGDTGPMLEDILLEGNLLLSLSYSRKSEGSADQFGISLAHAAGYDPNGIVTFFKALQREFGSGGPAWLSTHPSNNTRIEKMLQQIEGL